MAKDKIIIRGARQHNLKNIDLEIPRDKMVIITGLSGSGKSSLAFDTIYAEGQRRYVESLSSYARQFLGQMDKPDVEYIEGLSPAISIDQKTTSRNPRSTVGTVTEIHDYLRLLYARVGHPHCPKCGKPITQQTIDQMVDTVLALPEGTRIQVLAPIIRGRKGENNKLFEDIKKQGFARVRVDGQIYDLAEEEINLEKNKKHTVEIIVDRLVVRPDGAKRLADSLELALKQAVGLAVINIADDKLPDAKDMTFSQNFACNDCGVSMEELAPRMFSFNNPYGACKSCTGLGITMRVDPRLVLDMDKPLIGGGVIPWSKPGGTYYQGLVEALAERHGINGKETLIKKLPKDFIQELLYGNDGEKLTVSYYSIDNGWRKFSSAFEGVIINLERRFRETESPAMRQEIERYMTVDPCPDCGGARLKPESLAVTVADKNIYQVSVMTILEAQLFFAELKLSERETIIGRQILKEINERLKFLINVGLDYLSLSRSAGTLSGGEAQRIRLATQIGSGLVGVLYILDEPSIGLHQRDNAKLITALKRLRDIGNSVLVVEHDEDTMWEADHIIDIGPGAGIHGGEVVAQGTAQEIADNPNSITGAYLSGRISIPVPKIRKKPNGNYLKVKGATENNLKNINVDIPLGLFVCVTGVSGSGKSTFVNEIVFKAVAQHLYRAKNRPGAHKTITGLENLDKVIDIDQSPIGRTPRSNPATYTGVFDAIRELFSMTTEAKVRGYKTGRFSFNVKGGRCEACQGDGIIKIEMHFLPDVYVPCEVCKGKRYNRETMEVRYKGKNIAEVLEMTVDEAEEFFKNIPKIHRKMKTLQDVGLGYIHLGQAATTLSGGEAQRVKLASELSKRSTGKTLYILDEPTTGLHTYDIHKLLGVLQRLVENGDTVLVIEHNLDVIKTADYIIDLGPEGGNRGGTVIAKGTPEKVAGNPASYTGQYLQDKLVRGDGSSVLAHR